MIATNVQNNIPGEIICLQSQHIYSPSRENVNRASYFDLYFWYLVIGESDLILCTWELQNHTARLD